MLTKRDHVSIASFVVLFGSYDFTPFPVNLMP